jgi:hypothetical protein
MKDSLDMVTDVRSLINVQAIIDMLGEGKIYPHTRPAGRKDKMDIVVNALGVNNDAYQTGTANINLYAPAIKATQDAGNLQYLPDYFKLNALLKAVSPLVESQFRDTFHTDVSDPGTPLTDADGSAFVSIQLNYYSIQNNYKNI